MSLHSSTLVQKVAPHQPLCVVTVKPAGVHSCLLETVSYHKYPLTCTVVKVTFPANPTHSPILWQPTAVWLLVAIRHTVVRSDTRYTAYSSQIRHKVRFPANPTQPTFPYHGRDIHTNSNWKGSHGHIPSPSQQCSCVMAVHTDIS